MAIWTFTHCTVDRILDGDTFKLSLDLGFGITKKITARLYGFDTPETWRPICKGEAIFGKHVTDFVTNFIKDNIIHVRVLEKIGVYGRYNTSIKIIKGAMVFDLVKVLTHNHYSKQDLDCRKCDYYQDCDSIDRVYKKYNLHWRD